IQFLHQKYFWCTLVRNRSIGHHHHFPNKYPSNCNQSSHRFCHATSAASSEEFWRAFSPHLSSPCRSQSVSRIRSQKKTSAAQSSAANAAAAAEHLVSPYFSPLLTNQPTYLPTCLLADLVPEGLGARRRGTAALLLKGDTSESEEEDEE